MNHLTWQAHWFKLSIDFFDETHQHVGSFRHQQDKQLGGYAFVDESDGFIAHDLHYNSISVNCIPGKGTHKGYRFYHLSTGDWKGMLVIENTSYCYIESNNQPLVTYYRSRAWFKDTGELVFAQHTELWPLWTYAFFYTMSRFDRETY